MWTMTFPQNQSSKSGKLVGAPEQAVSSRRVSLCAIAQSQVNPLPQHSVLDCKLDKNGHICFFQSSWGGAGLKARLAT
jgi:hypothetical protein